MDASGYAIGGVLSQEQEGKLKPIAFLSRTMQLAVRRGSHQGGSPQNVLGGE